MPPKPTLRKLKTVQSVKDILDEGSKGSSPATATGADIPGSPGKPSKKRIYRSSKTLVHQSNSDEDVNNDSGLHHRASDFFQEHEQNRIKSKGTGSNLAASIFQRQVVPVVDAQKDKETGAITNLMGMLRNKSPAKPATSTRGQALWKKSIAKQRVLTHLMTLNRQINNEFYGIDDRNLDDEIKQEKHFSLDPAHPAKQVWNVILSCFMIYLSIFYIFIIAFLEPFTAHKVISLIMSGVFAIDLVLNFFTAYPDEDEVLIRDPKSICKHYLRTWFIVDLISLFPVYALSMLHLDNDRTMGAYRYLLLVPIIRVTRMISNMLQSNWMRYFKKFKNLGTQMIRMIKILLLALYLVHVAVCIFMIIARVEPDIGITWIYRYNLEQLSSMEKYLVGAYWAVQTLATVGFGDIHLETNAERLFGIVWIAFGSAFYSFLISNLQSVVERAGANQQDLKGKMSAIIKFARETDLPEDFIQKLKKYMESSHRNHTQASTEDSNIIDELPYTLKAQILISMNAKVVEKITFFENKDVDLILKVVPQLKPLTLNTNEILYREGDYTEEVFFVAYGIINLKASNGIIFSTVNEGNLLGEIEVIQNIMRMATAQAAVPSQLFSLEKKIFMDMIRDFPDVGQQLTRNNITNRAELLRKKNAVSKIKGLQASKVFNGTHHSSYAVDTSNISKRLVANPLEKAKADLNDNIKRGVGKLIKLEIQEQQNSKEVSLSQKLKSDNEKSEEENKKEVSLIEDKTLEGESTNQEEQVNSLMLEMYDELLQKKDSFLQSYESNIAEMEKTIQMLQHRCDTASGLLLSVQEIGKKQDQIEEYLTSLLS